MRERHAEPFAILDFGLEGLHEMLQKPVESELEVRTVAAFLGHGNRTLDCGLAGRELTEVVADRLAAARRTWPFIPPDTHVGRYRLGRRRDRRPDPLSRHVVIQALG